MNVAPDKADVAAARQLPAADDLPQTVASLAIDRIVKGVGETASLLWLVLVLVIIVNVALRYLFGHGYVALEELQWHIYGVAFLFAIAYCLQRNRHVRIDVLSESWSPRTRAWIEAIGVLVFLLPFTGAVLVKAWDLAYRSWRLNEISVSPGGLPYRWVIKSAIVVGFVLLGLAAVSRLLGCTALLFGFPNPRSTAVQLTQRREGIPDGIVRNHRHDPAVPVHCPAVHGLSDRLDPWRHLGPFHVGRNHR